MRLLRREDDGEFSMIERYRENIPPYAILSHTWCEVDGDEVSLKDILKRRSEIQKKPGYDKLKFCAQQAASDGLEYFWIDTCCINQSSSAELSEAINSMFQWYQNARRCYVYLSDVSLKIRSSISDEIWRDSFLRCRWFKRGWTLQELLAPKSVDFFSAEGVRLGGKASLMHLICEATKIPDSALQGHLISEFSVEERLSWAEGRDTKREEDAAYSLFGLFDVHMPLIYGEGRAKAFLRLRREIQASRDLEDTNSQSQSKPIVEAPLLAAEETEINLKSETGLWRPNSDPETVLPYIMKSRWDSTSAKQVLPSGYRKVAVLLLKWVDELDELMVRREVAELGTVFRETFHFHTSLVELDASRKPQHQMNRYLDNFIEQHDGPDNLLILHYSGHSRYDEDNNQLVLVPNLSYVRTMFRDISINWSRVDTSLAEDVEGDVLTLMDACYSSNQVFSSLRPTPRGPGRNWKMDKKVFETLSACALDNTTATPGPASFTRALIDALIALAAEFHGGPFTTFQLNQRITLAPRRRDMPSLLWSLTDHDHHIRLAPLIPEGQDNSVLSKSRHNARGYLTLGIPLPKDSLTLDQIDFLASQLTRAVCHQVIGGGMIDWLGIRTMAVAGRQFAVVVFVALAVVRFKKPISKRKSSERFRRFNIMKRHAALIRASSGNP